MIVQLFLMFQKLEQKKRGKTKINFVCFFFARPEKNESRKIRIKLSLCQQCVMVISSLLKALNVGGGCYKWLQNTERDATGGEIELFLFLQCVWRKFENWSNKRKERILEESNRTKCKDLEIKWKWFFGFIFHQKKKFISKPNITQTTQRKHPSKHHPSPQQEKPTDRNRSTTTTTTTSTIMRKKERMERKFSESTFKNNF